MSSPLAPISWGDAKCYICKGRKLVEKATPAEVVGLRIPPGVGVCLDCSIKCPELEIAPEQAAEIDERAELLTTTPEDVRLYVKDESDFTRTFGNF